MNPVGASPFSRNNSPTVNRPAPRDNRQSVLWGKSLGNERGHIARGPRHLVSNVKSGETDRIPPEFLLSTWYV